MKNYIYCALAITLLTGSGVHGQTPDLSDANAAEAMMKKAQNLQQDIERLKALKPLAKAQLLLLLPETLGKLKKTRYDKGDENGMGITSVRGTYNTIDEPEFLPGKNGSDIMNEKNKTFSIEVVDGAGPGAPIFASMMMMSDTNIGMTNGNQQVKQVTVNGISGRQTFKKTTNHTAIHFFYLDRFSISVTGSHMIPEETWEHFEKFDLGVLSPKD